MCFLRPGCNGHGGFPLSSPGGPTWERLADAVGTPEQPSGWVYSQQTLCLRQPVSESGNRFWSPAEPADDVAPASLLSAAAHETQPGPPVGAAEMETATVHCSEARRFVVVCYLEIDN